ncbi:MAG: DNA photolyase [Gammaproteobacteria bacterium]
MQFIYIEDAVRDHPQTQAIIQRFEKSTRVPIQHYGEVFNRKGQNFRLQKQQPALILADKHNERVLPAPPGYGIGGRHNYYFSHMLNCVYDCRYCFLQGMYRSAHYIIFVNYEDFRQAIVDTATRHPGEETWFYSGYDCDSLAYEPVTGFVQAFLPTFAGHGHAWLELRTKSTQIRSLLEHSALPNVVVAFSFTPEAISAQHEHGVPSVAKRIEAMTKLQAQGWKLGLRFDPMIYHPDYQQQYTELFQQIFARIDPAAVHSVSLGAFRIPRGFYQNVAQLYPDNALFAYNMENTAGMMSYPLALEQAMLEYCQAQLLAIIPESIFFSCTPPGKEAV